MSFFKIDAVEIPFPVIKHSQMITMDLKPEDFGGEFRNPKFLHNPMCIVDVTEQMSYQFKIELSDPDVNCMICLVGVDTDLEDPRHVNYSYFEKQANPGMYHQGVSELNCLLEVGRYLLVCAIQNIRPVPCKVTVIVNSYAEKLSDHPCVQEKTPDGVIKPFSLAVIDKQRLSALMKHRQVHSGSWPAMRSKAVNQYISPVFSEFHSNPGVIIHNPKVPTKFLFHLRSLGYQRSFLKATNSDFRYGVAEAPELSICIMKINNRNDIRPLIPFEESKSTAAWGSWTK